MIVKQWVFTVVETNGVVTGIISNAKIQDSNPIVQTLEDGHFLAAEETGIGETVAWSTSQVCV